MNPAESFDELFGLVIALTVYAFVRWLQYHYPDPPPRRGEDRRKGGDRRSGQDRRRPVEDDDYDAESGDDEE